MSSVSWPSMLDVQMTCATQDQLFPSASCHARDPRGSVASGKPSQVFERSNVVDLDSVCGSRSAAEFTDLCEEPPFEFCSTCQHLRQTVIEVGLDIPRQG